MAGLGLGSVGSGRRGSQRPGQCCVCRGWFQEAPGESGSMWREEWTSVVVTHRTIRKLQREMGRGVVCDRSPSGAPRSFWGGGGLHWDSPHLLPTPHPTTGVWVSCSGQKWLLRSVAMGINVGRNQPEWTPATVFFPKKLHPRIASRSLFFGNMCLTVGFPCYLFPIFGCSWTGVVCGFQGWGAGGPWVGVSSHRPFLALPF